MIASPEMVFEAVQRLRSGGVVAAPTETVYGLAAIASSDEAVRSLIELRGRDEGKPLSVAVSDEAMAGGLVGDWPTLGGVSSRELAKQHWPGPLTLVLPLSEGVRLPKHVTGGGRTVGVRCPDHPLALALIQTLGEPVVLPSANPPGQTPATSAEMVRDYFGDSVYVIDGGTCEGSTPSTVVSFAGEKAEVLREGVLGAGELGMG